MMPKDMDGFLVTHFNFVIRNQDGGMFVLERHEVTGEWSLWYWCQKKYLSLNHADGTAVMFDSPEKIVAYCGAATTADPEWANFEKGVCGGLFPPRMEVEGAWSPLVDLHPTDSPRRSF